MHCKQDIEEHSVEVNGHSLRYQLINYVSGKPLLVFLHEGLGSIGQWKDFPVLLCKKTALPGLIYDRFGHGRSGKWEESRKVSYMHNYSLIEFPGLLEALNISNPLILIGHSDGGSIALIYAAYYPEKVQAIITEAAHVFVEKRTVTKIAEMMGRYRKCDDLRSSLSRYHFENTASMFYGWGNVWLLDEFLHWNIEAVLPKVKAPVLALQGGDDEYGSKAQIDSIMQNTTGKSEYFMIPGCKHDPHHQARSVTLQKMAAYLHDIVKD